MKRSNMSRRCIAALAAVLMSAAGALGTGSADAQEWNWINPAVKDFGAVVALPNAGMQPDKNADYKVVFNVTSWGTPDTVQPGLERIARTINVFASAGVPLSRLHMIAVLHGPATPAVLDNSHYREKFGVDNPNVELIAALEKAGAQVVVCGQALAHNKFPDAWVNLEVEITLSALTDIIILQQQGYVLMPL
jgi:intracellular sulfur oxidation DsrE/DsrF family protein